MGCLSQYLQTADSKYPNEGSLLSTRKVEVADDRHRQHNNHKVEYDADGGIAKPYGVAVEALGRLASRPKGVDWRAEEYRTKNRPGREACDEGENDPADDPEPFEREDVEVLEENRAFGEPEREIVDYQTGIERLEICISSGLDRHREPWCTFNNLGESAGSKSTMCLPRPNLTSVQT